MEGITMNPLLDQDFLIKLYSSQTREVYAKVTLLDFDENALADYEGKISQGSVNLDGSSAIRRTCSLTVIAELDEVQSYMWALNSKFKMQVGLKNVLKSDYPDYPDIIWFPMGIYFITSFNINRGTTQTTISIQGKDKMALLSGDLGGTIPALTWDFGSIDETDSSGKTTTKKYLIKNIIREAVHEFAHEPFHNIIINDIDDEGLELLQYNYSKPMYLLNDVKADVVTQFTLNAKQGTYYKLNEDYTLEGTVVTFEDNDFEFDTRNSLLESTPTYFTTIEYLPQDYDTPCERPYTCIKAEQGDTIGYRNTDLVYAGDLISSVGESVVSMLDKIKNMLGDYEYFYNLEGQFVFQRKKISLQHPWNVLKRDSDTGEQYVDVDLYANQYEFEFDNNSIVTSFSNTPNISNVKNDFVVWGTKKGNGNNQTPVHCRYAIMDKPTRYKSYDGEVYVTDMEYTISGDENVKVRDWRELIYQMAIDYRKHMHDAETPDAETDFIDSFLPVIAQNNPEYIDGQTGYEQFYVDMEGFWRLLYNPDYVGEYYVATGLTEEEYNDSATTVYVFVNQSSSSYNSNAHYYTLYPGSTTRYSYAGKITQQQFGLNKAMYYVAINPKASGQSFNPNEVYYYLDDDDYYKDSDDDNIKYWNKEIFYNPQNMLFWIDFVDTKENSELSKYSIRNIGLRTYAKNDTAVRAVVYKDVPNVMFIENTNAEEIERMKAQNTGYTILPLSEGLMNAFNISIQGKSGKDEIDSQIYSKACCCESVTMSTIPIYHLEPNARIYVQDIKSGINGAYMADKFTINLAYNGMMNITATKIIDRII